MTLTKVFILPVAALATAMAIATAAATATATDIATATANAIALHHMPNTWSLRTVRPLLNFQNPHSSSLHKLVGPHKQFKATPLPPRYAFTDNTKADNDQLNAVSVGAVPRAAVNKQTDDDDDDDHDDRFYDEWVYDKGGNNIAESPTTTAAVQTNEERSDSEDGTTGGFLQTKDSATAEWQFLKNTLTRIRNLFGYKPPVDNGLLEHAIDVFDARCNEEFCLRNLTPFLLPFDDNYRYADESMFAAAMRDLSEDEKHSAVVAAMNIACVLGRIFHLKKFNVSVCV
eukprot:GHVQ01003904.1.p1 GENE.GHVQ01003904.1~~GHVQ01003904.1.p1  ORF type:complete len:286 (-),score=62.42 GHVQ01003904.1:13-870(-)